MKLNTIFLALLLVSSQAFGAVAHDGEVDQVGSNGSAAATLTAASKTTAGSDRIGIAAVVTAGDAVTGCTWGGVSMTQKGKVTNGTDGRTSYIYWIAAPATASSSVVCSLSPDARGTLVASSYTGAHQTTQDATAATASGTASPATVDASSASGEMVVDSLYFFGAGTAPAVGAGQTENQHTDDGNFFGSSSREAGAGTVTMSWTLTSPTRWSIIATSIRQVSAGSSVVPHMIQQSASNDHVFDQRVAANQRVLK